MRRFLLSFPFLALVLTACPSNTNPPSGRGSISGTVTLAATPGSLDANKLKVGPSSFPQLRDSEFVVGEIIVKFRPTVSLQSVQNLRVGGVTLQRVQDLGLEATSLYRAVGLDQAGTLELIRQLSVRSDVVYAHPNFILKAFKTPNDDFYSFQWHYSKINLPQAWDIEDGTTNDVIVAVIDTGIVKAHPDFAEKLLPGYDFISNPQTANDGNGRDPDPEDTGNTGSEEEASGYHGTHVAGTVAAATNNSLGVAGVSWGAKIVPVRVLGVGGGSLADIIAGMTWAAGLSVTGVPNIEKPAQVLNLSLGGKFRCTDAPAYQDAINAINAQPQKPIIVVAAGNSADNASLYAPASCTGVITVGATEFRNFRSYYSNWGPRIDVMAPGGDSSVDRNDDKYVDGVLSTMKDDKATGADQYIYSFLQGTSMASPHVAGVAALMKSKKPTLDVTEALDILKRTARPLSNSSCDGAYTNPYPTPSRALTSSDCGAGLVDVQAALNELGGSTPQPSFTLLINPTSAAITPSGSSQFTVSIARTGGFNSVVTLSLQGAPSGVSAQFNPNNTTANSSIMTLNVAGGTATGTYPLTVQGTGGSLTRTVGLSLTVGNPPPPVSLSGTLVAALFVTSTGAVDIDKSKGITLTQNSQSAPYSIPDLEAGDYIVLAWKDVDGNGDVTQGDYLGGYVNSAGDLLLVQPTKSGINVAMDIVQGTGHLSTKADSFTPLLPKLKR